MCWTSRRRKGRGRSGTRRGGGRRKKSTLERSQAPPSSGEERERFALSEAAVGGYRRGSSAGSPGAQAHGGQARKRLRTVASRSKIAIIFIVRIIGTSVVRSRAQSSLRPQTSKRAFAKATKEKQRPYAVLHATARLPGIVQRRLHSVASPATSNEPRQREDKEDAVRNVTGSPHSLAGRAPGRVSSPGRVIRVVK